MFWSTKKKKKKNGEERNEKRAGLMFFPTHPTYNGPTDIHFIFCVVVATAIQFLRSTRNDMAGLVAYYIYYTKY